MLHIILYLIVSTGAFFIGLVRTTSDIRRDRRQGALIALTCWAWPLWLAYGAIVLIWALIRTAITGDD